MAYYTNTTTLTAGTLARASDVESKFDVVATGFTTAETDVDSVASGLALKYFFSTTTTDSDPGYGLLRFDNATQSSATRVRLSLRGAESATWTNVIDTWNDATSSITGLLKISQRADATKYLLFNVTSVASATSYRNVFVVNTASSGSNPFAASASLMLSFIRAGDKGDTGATGATGAAGSPTDNPTLNALATASASFIANTFLLFSAPQVASAAPSGSLGRLGLAVESASSYRSLLGVNEGLSSLAASSITYTTNNSVMVDTSAGALNGALPASSATGSFVELVDHKGTWHTNNLTLFGNGATIEGTTSYILDVRYARPKFITNGSDWKAR